MSSIAATHSSESEGVDIDLGGNAIATNKTPLPEASPLSPLTRFETPLSASFFSSSSSVSLPPFSGIAASTPLSSLDSGEALSPSSAVSSAMDQGRSDTEDKDEKQGQDTAVSAVEGGLKRSEKGEAPLAPLSVAAVDVFTTTMAQSTGPIRGTDAAPDTGQQKDTRSKNGRPNNSDVVTTTPIQLSDTNDNTIGSLSTSTPGSRLLIHNGTTAFSTSTSTTVSQSAAHEQLTKAIATPQLPEDLRPLEDDAYAQNEDNPPAETFSLPTSTISKSSEYSSLHSTTLVRSASNRSANSLNVSSSHSGATASSPSSTLIRPKFTKPPPPPPPPQKPAIVRTVSSHGNLPLRQPIPELNTRTGAFVGNIAQLEATAEQLSMTSSIEDAIREAHQELKRSDSRRSSILAANLRKTSGAQSGSNTAASPAIDVSLGDATSSQSLSRRASSRQGHIAELNSARSGGFCSNENIMSPSSSVTGRVRQRSASKSSSTGSGGIHSSSNNLPGVTDPTVPANDAFPFLSRHGPGKASVRSVRSNQLTLPEIAELGPPVTLTQDALDEADRLLAAGEDIGDDDTVRAVAHQQVDFDPGVEFATHSELAASQEPSSEHFVLNPINIESPSSSLHFAPTTGPMDNYLGYEISQAASHDFANYHSHHASEEMRNLEQAQSAVEAPSRPATSGSGTTFEQAQTAFEDFDGVHCDPDIASLQLPETAPPIAQIPQSTPKDPQMHRSRPPPPPPPRPTSYLDPETGRQMLYYPARVPAMLQLPPKLSRNPKAAERNNRRSQVLSTMMHQQLEKHEPQPERQSRIWLPDPLSGDVGSPLLGPKDQLSPEGLTSPSISADASPATDGVNDGSKAPADDFLGINASIAAGADAGPATGSTGNGQEGNNNDLHRPARRADHDKRKSRMSTLSKLPPQLRASAYFDLPSTTANVEVKNGSATDTLESILNAAAKAPVYAFTDHTFAGHLGSEVYGSEKKRTKRNTTSSNLVMASGGNANDANTNNPYRSESRGLPGSKSRGSFLSLVGHIRKVSDPLSASDGQETTEKAISRRSRLSKKVDAAMLSPGLSEDAEEMLRPGEDDHLSGEEDDGQRSVHDDENESEVDEERDEDEDGDEDGEERPVYQGPPTTLLAELQLRKQQQKLRTRPINKAFPNGMHSTLLELDAVAEVERKARKDKRVNLAWEDPAMIQQDDEGDDDDVPLGMLYAAKAAGHNDISAVVAEINRPLGLMEKKALEDNEPLSRRRDRLQGRDPGVSMHLGPGGFGGNAMKRQTMVTLAPTLAAMNPAAAINSGSPQMAGVEGGDGSVGQDEDADPGVEEVEDEPLAARLQRLKAKEESELPRARPVSTAFSSELLEQFADPEEEAKERAQKQDKERAKARAGTEAQPPEQEETLGQRRRRLQAEKEAREQEMLQFGRGDSSNLAVNNQALHALTGSNRLSHRISMADILSAHPLDSARGAQNPREAERQRREQEAVRAAFEREQKMAALRSQMPLSMSTTSLGGNIAKPGGFMGGRFNDTIGGMGGVGSVNRAVALQHGDGPGVGPWAKPGTLGGPMGNAHVLNPNMTGTMANMNGLTGMSVGAAGFASGLNNPGIAMNYRNASYGNGFAMPQQSAMGMNTTNYGIGAGVNPTVGAQAYGGYGSIPMQLPLPMSMPMQMPVPPQGQIDRVERWRQGVQP
ncbi:hypothetical protein SPI_07774 [Niveomyces insectorum RCEF 264]|uniref:Uncharacterized protein n=1 Tax=Niveomyces insectorum RCEF 264 TaxID=1081102 RepID=A0A167P0U0_9HYPO|nr:hypothetical protein SPI_07774 [Niveomyces insectorum RCEF 264]